MADIEIGGGVESATTRDAATLWFDALNFMRDDKATAKDQATLWFDASNFMKADRATVKDQVAIWVEANFAKTDRATVGDYASVFIGDENRHKFSGHGSPFYSRGCPFFS